MPSTKKITDQIAVFIATGFGVGRLVKIGQGTIAAALTFIFIPWFVGITAWQQILLCIALSILGVWTSGVAEKIFQTKDDHRIVIDEIVSVFVMLAFFPVAILSPIWLFIALVLNRVLDIAKPLGINSLQRLPGGWGVMVDDLAVGVMASIILHLAFHFI